MSQPIKKSEPYSHFFRFTGRIINQVHTENLETFGPVLVFSKPATPQNPLGEEFGVTRNHLVDIYRSAVALSDGSRQAQQALWVMEGALMKAWEHAGLDMIDNSRQATLGYIIEKGFEPPKLRPAAA